MHSVFPNKVHLSPLKVGGGGGGYHDDYRCAVTECREYRKYGEICDRPREYPRINYLELQVCSVLNVEGKPHDILT